MQEMVMVVGQRAGAVLSCQCYRLRLLQAVLRILVALRRESAVSSTSLEVVVRARPPCHCYRRAQRYQEGNRRRRLCVTVVLPVVVLVAAVMALG